MYFIQDGPFKPLTLQEEGIERFGVAIVDVCM